MKKLDLYIIKKFLGTYFFMILVVMSISIIFDVSEKLRDFTNPKNNLTVGEIVFDYYPYFFVHYANMFSSLIIFLSVLWFTSLMAQRTEVIAILSNGVSFARFARPFFIASTLLLVVSLLMNHYVAPYANMHRLDFESRYTNVVHVYKDVHLEMEPGQLVSYKYFSAKEKMAYRMWLENWVQDSTGLWVLKSDMQIENAWGDSLTNDWKLTKVFHRKLTPDGEVIRWRDTIDTTLSFNTMVLGQREEFTFAMTTPELKAFEKLEAKRGRKVSQIQIVRHERDAYPFAAYILTLIGISVASRKSRNGVGLNLVIGLTAGLVYVFFMKITTVAATNVGLYPEVAVWIPNAIFSVAALVLYYKRVTE